MGVLSATEKLKILALGKATLKEINELEKLAENEVNTPPETKPEGNTPPETKPEGNTPPEGNEPDEKDLKIARLEEQLKKAQAENVHANNGGNEPTFEEQLDSMFKDYRF